MEINKKVNKYQELKEKHQQEFDNLPMFFAFSNDQFTEGMKNLNLDSKTDIDKIFSTFGGGYIRKTDFHLLNEIGEAHIKRMNDSIATDLTGEGFIYDMLLYELNNHEYGYTGDISDTLDSLDLTMKVINENENLAHGLKKAKIDIMKEDC